jgi:hypothetical protein
MRFPEVLCEVLDVGVEGNTVRAQVNTMESPVGVIVHDMEEEVGPVGEFLGAVEASIVDRTSGGGVPWHKLMGTELMGDLLTKLVSLDEMVVVFLVCVKLVGALRGKGAGMLLTFWVRQGVEGKVRLQISNLAVGARSFWRGQVG